MVALNASDCDHTVMALLFCIRNQKLKLANLLETRLAHLVQSIEMNVNHSPQHAGAPLLIDSHLIARQLHSSQIISFDEQLDSCWKAGHHPRMYGGWYDRKSKALTWHLHHKAQ